MTKKKLIQAITKKVEKAKPITKEVFLSGLEYKTKKELKSILRKIEVSDDGYGITTL